MNTPSKFAGFALGLAAIFGIAVVLGAAIGPTPDAAAGHDTHPAGPAATGGSSPDQLPGGLLVSDRGYTLQLDTPRVRPGAEVAVGFRILDAAGLPVTRYERSHDKDLHGSTPAGPGITFSLTAPTSGDYRLFLDFQHKGTVRTAEFTVRVTPDTANAEPRADQVGDQPGHGH